MSTLSTFDKDFAGENELIQLMLQRRITWLLKQGKVDAAVVEAQRMMGQFPDSAAPVVDKVLTVLDQQMDELRKQIGAELVEANKQTMRDQIKQKADAAVKLAKMLSDWAAGQKFADAPESAGRFDLHQIAADVRAEQGSIGAG